MKALSQLVIVAITLLLVVNTFGGVVSGIWLAILGEWRILLGGILSLVIAPFIIAICMMPGIALLFPAAFLYDKKLKIPSYLLMLLGGFYTVGVIAAWCGYVFYVLYQKTQPGTAIPILIWSYGIAAGPIAYMASKEKGNDDNSSSAAVTFFAQISYLVMIVMALIWHSDYKEIVIVMACIMFIGYIAQMGFSIHAFRQERAFSALPIDSD